MRARSKQGDARTDASVSRCVTVCQPIDPTESTSSFAVSLANPRLGAQHRPTRGLFEITPQVRHSRPPRTAVDRDDLGGELTAAFDMPIEASIEAFRADPIAATQD